jgi:hypothetical protein
MAVHSSINPISPSLGKFKRAIVGIADLKDLKEHSLTALNVSEDSKRPLSGISMNNAGFPTINLIRYVGSGNSTRYSESFRGGFYEPWDFIFGFVDFYFGNLFFAGGDNRFLYPCRKPPPSCPPIKHEA